MAPVKTADSLQRRIASLELRNEELLTRVVDAEQVMNAFARGEVDAVTLESSTTPVLLHAAQTKLRGNQRLLEDAQAIAHMGSWKSGSDSGDEIEWSRECYRIFGVPTGTAMTVESFFEHVHCDDRARVQQASRDAWERGVPYEIAHRITRLDGSVRWVQESAIVERDEAGQATRMVGTVQDVTDRHLADEALRTSEAEFRLLAEAMPQIVWITRPDGGNVYFNRHWTEYTGLTLEESFGDGWNRPFHPDDQQRAWQAWQDATSTDGTYALECRLRRADGVYRWWLIRGVPVKDASGNILKWFGTCTDIDELKQGQERLRVLHDVAEVMRTADDALQAVPAALRVLGSYLGASRCAYAVIDADREHYEVLHDHTDDCASMKGRHRLSERGALLLVDPSREGAPVVVRDVDAELGHDATAALGPAGIKAFVCCSPTTQAGLRAIMVIHQSTPRDWTSSEISIVQEVVDRCCAAVEKSADEAKLRENEALLRITGHAARLGGWSISLPDRNVTWSDEVCAILDMPPGTAISLEHATALYPPEFRDTIREKIDDCARDGTPFDLELQIITAQSRCIWVRAIGRASRDATGAITSLHGAFQDIDDRRKLQDQFRQAQKMEAVGRLAGGVAHDFNNLLSVVLSYSELAIEGLKPGDPLREDMEEINKAGTRATELTRQLLAFSRQQVLEPRVIDLNEILGEMTPMLRRLLGEDVEVAVLATAASSRVVADPTQVEQVVMNLAVNARDAMPAGGTLTLETANVSVDDTYVGKPEDVAPGPFVMLTVTDNGEGMSEATRARVFEPFFTTKETGKGTGLGLATVFGIVQQSHGYVRVQSERGRGTTFQVYFPETDRVADAAVSIAATAMLDGSETILVAEDDDQVRNVACAVLRRHGYNVLETSNGGEAFLVSSDFSGEIDLLLTDVIMPRVSGRQLAEKLTAQRPEMKVLFASGYTDDAISRHGVLDAGVAFLQKPFAPKALLKKVREVLDAAR